MITAAQCIADAIAQLRILHELTDATRSGAADVALLRAIGSLEHALQLGADHSPSSIGAAVPPPAPDATASAGGGRLSPSAVAPGWRVHRHLGMLRGAHGAVVYQVLPGGPVRVEFKSAARDGLFRSLSTRARWVSDDWGTAVEWARYMLDHAGDTDVMHEVFRSTAAWRPLHVCESLEACGVTEPPECACQTAACCGDPECNCGPCDVCGYGRAVAY